MKRDLSYYAMKFKKGEISRKEFLKLISKYIFLVANLKKFYGRDIKHDFFFYIAGKIEKIIKNYRKIEGASFEDWIFVVLKNQFLYFLKTRIKKSDNEKAIYLLGFNEELFEENSLFENNCKDKIDFSFLTYKERLVAAFKFGINFFDIKSSGVSEIILKKIEKRKKLELKFNKRNLQIIKLQNSINNTYEIEKKEFLVEKEKVVKRYRDNIATMLNKFSIYPSNKWVSERLGISQGTVAAFIFKIKRKIKERYSGFFDKVKNDDKEEKAVF